MTIVNANEVALGIESFGDDDAPLVLLAGGTTMLSWPDALCHRLAAGGRRVVRFDRQIRWRPPTRCATSLPTRRPLSTRSAADLPTSPESESAGWSPRSPRSTIPARSRRTLAGTRAVAPGRPEAMLTLGWRTAQVRVTWLSVPQVIPSMGLVWRFPST